MAFITDSTLDLLNLVAGVIEFSDCAGVAPPKGSGELRSQGDLALISAFKWKWYLRIAHAPRLVAQYRH